MVQKTERDLYFLDRNILNQFLTGKLDTFRDTIRNQTNNIQAFDNTTYSALSILPILREGCLGACTNRDDLIQYYSEIFSFISDWYVDPKKAKLTAKTACYRKEIQDLDRYLELFGSTGNNPYGLIGVEILFNGDGEKLKNTMISSIDDDMKNYNLIQNFYNNYSPKNKEERKKYLYALFDYAIDNDIGNNICLFTLILAICGNQIAQGIIYHKNNSPWNAYSDLSIFDIFNFAYDINDLFKDNPNIDPFENIMIVTSDKNLFEYYKFVYLFSLNRQNKIPIKNLDQLNFFPFIKNEEGVRKLNIQEIQEINVSKFIFGNLTDVFDDITTFLKR